MNQTSNIARQRAAGRSTGGPAYQARRREILGAAVDVFKVHGYRGTTLAHIAEALDADRASLYYYVSGKQEIFEEIVSEAIETNLQRSFAIRDGPGTGAARVHALVRSVMASYDEFYPVLYVLVQENLTHLDPSRREWADQMRRTIRDWEQVLIDLVTAGQEDGTIRGESPAWLLAYGISGMVSWTNRWYRPGMGGPGPEQIGETFAAMVLDGLSPR